MVAVPLGQSSFKRRLGRSAEILLTNMFLEKDPTNFIDGFVRLQRPGLAPWQIVGTGPIRGLYQESGVFNGDYLVVSGQQLYRVTQGAVATLLGAVNGTDPVVIDASKTRALIATGTICYSTDGTTITQVNVPDIDGVPSPILSVAFINEYFLLTVNGAQHIFWLAPGDVDPDALNFFSAEYGPDNLQRVARISDQIFFFGDGTIEVWIPGTDVNLPFQRVQGMLFDKGCASAYTVAALDNTLFWVGADRVVYRAETGPIQISNPAIEEHIREADPAQMRAWAFARDGHTFYVLTIMGVGTFVYDVYAAAVSGLGWCVFSSYGMPIWAAHLGAQANGIQVIAGDAVSGQLYLLDSDRSNDNGQPFVREITGGVPVIGPPVPSDSFSVFVATGWAPINGPAAKPSLAMRYSDDGGQTFSSWLLLPLRLQGQYGEEVTVYRLGEIPPPGRIFTLRMTDDTLYRISYARMNEPLST